MDLTKVFQPVVTIPPQSEAVRTLVSDIFGTLIKADRTLNKPVHDFLLWVKDCDFTVLLASSDPARAQEALRHAGCNPVLLEGGVQEKIVLMNSLVDEEIPHIALDDSFLIWLDAVAVLPPNDRRLAPYLESAGYIDTLRFSS